MDEFMNKLLNDSFLVAIQVNNSDTELKSHSYGFKKKNVMTYDDRVSILPSNQIKNESDFLKLIKSIYKYKKFHSISVAAISNELYCKIFNVSEEDFKKALLTNTHEILAEEEFGWFTYGLDYMCYRIPKELVVGSFKYDENSDTVSFVYNSNYYMNLSDEERKKFVATYKELIMNEVENDDYSNEYPYGNIMELKKKI